MNPPPVRDRLQAVLIALGWTVDTTAKTRKYIVMVKEGEKRKLYLGRAGALRVGTNRASSYPFDSFKRVLLSGEKKNG